MIGGRNQSGRWKLDARYNRTELADGIARIARYRDRIHLSKLDATEFLVRTASTLPVKALVYLDPPYYVKGQRRLYANQYEEDPIKIAGLLSVMPFHWLVSHDNAPAIRRLNGKYRRLTYRLRYTAAERHQGIEGHVPHRI